ncbi:hypothetical protein JTB14_001257 [Gonioctena quinquepunctata]|nr:hypothetical protein JTB14_001257 [Gonioctena quinquepunctata]
MNGMEREKDKQTKHEQKKTENEENAFEGRDPIVSSSPCENKRESEDSWLQQWKMVFYDPDYVISQRRSPIARSPTRAITLATTNMENQLDFRKPSITEDLKR